MNIVILTDLSGGGEQKVNDEIIRALAKQSPQENFQIHSLKPARIIKGWFSGFKNISLNRQSIYQRLIKQTPQSIDCLLALCSSSRLIFQLIKTLNASIPIIHFYHADINFLYPLYKASLNPRQIISSFLTNIYTRFLHTQSLRLADKIIVASRLCRRDLISKYGVSSNRICLLPIGVNHKIYKPNHKSLRRPTIVFCGRIEPEKGLDRLIVALSTLKPIRRLTLIVVHPRISPDKKEFSHRCQKLIHNCGAHLTVRYVQPSSEDVIASLYQSATCVVLPSISETGPNVMYEALASGTLFVGTPIGAIPEVLSAVNHKLILLDRKPETIAKCLEWIFSLSPSVRKALIAKGKRAVIHLTWENTAYRLINILKTTSQATKH